MFATTKKFWSTMQLITNKHVLYMRLFIFTLGGGGLVQFNVPSLKRMNFSHTGLHVCYNQEILVNIAADHRQICVIYKRLFIFALGGGGLVPTSYPGSPCLKVLVHVEGPWPFSSPEPFSLGHSLKIRLWFTRPNGKI